MPKPRVFVSSVIDGFKPYREAARAAIISAGGEPVLVNEDFPSQGASSRNACLDAVDSCEIFILLIGERGGWHAPSGKLVVEEELDRAQLRHLRCLVFLQSEVAQDNEAKRLIRSVSDYVTGYFRTTFRDETELKNNIEEALKEPLGNAMTPRANGASFQKMLIDAPSLIQNQVSIRFLVTPQREEEVLSPMKLASADFGNQVLQIGHASDVKLLSYQFAKSKPTVAGGEFVLNQNGGGNWRSGQQEVRLTIGQGGAVMIDLNVTGRVERREDRYGMGGILIQDLTDTLKSCFDFTAKFYESFDPYRRQDSFIWGTALVGAGYKRILQDETDRAANRPNMSGTDKAIPAFAALRPIARAVLSKSEEEMDRAILAWRQELNKFL